MEGRFVIFIMVMFIATAVIAKPTHEDVQDPASAGICDIKPRNRYDCGWFGIDQETCQNKGCCWNSSVPNSLYCYFSKNGPAPTCDVSGVNRYECGWLGIDEGTCLKRGCCWDDIDPYAKFCYVKGNTHLPDGLCPVAPSERQECGYYGITKDECLSKSCCWDDTVAGAKWCFKQPVEMPPLGCYIYHGVSGICKYLCDQDERKNYGMPQCQGRICCVCEFII